MDERPEDITFEMRPDIVIVIVIVIMIMNIVIYLDLKF